MAEVDTLQRPDEDFKTEIPNVPPPGEDFRSVARARMEADLAEGKDRSGGFNAQREAEARQAVVAAAIPHQAVREHAPAAPVQPAEAPKDYSGGYYAKPEVSPAQAQISQLQQQLDEFSAGHSRLNPKAWMQKRKMRKQIKALQGR